MARDHITGGIDIDLELMFSSRVIEGWKRQSWWSALLDWLFGDDE